MVPTNGAVQYSHKFSITPDNNAGASARAAFISGASMNPARALAPALLSGVMENLWLYWTAPFVGTMIAAFAFRGKFKAQREREAKT